MTQHSTAMVRTHQMFPPERLFVVKACDSCTFFRPLAPMPCAKTGAGCNGKGCAGHSAANLPNLRHQGHKTKKWGEMY